MSFLRPEAKETLTRWQDVIIGGAVLVLGLYFATSLGIVRWLGFAIIALGAVMIVAGIQRARFRRANGGIGVIEVDEGQISYFAPISGGVAAHVDIRKVTLMTVKSGQVWVVSHTGGAPLIIPIGAPGADQLFDAFGALAGFDTGAMLRALETDADHPIVIWEKTPAALH